MERPDSVDSYIETHPQWAEALALLRRLILSAPVQETIKWGGPVYTVEGKNVLGLGAFQSWVALWFFQGALLKDPRRKLINAQENVTKALRQWRFTSMEEIEREKEAIRAYILEAVQNQKQGRMIPPQRNKPLQIPAELQEHLSANTDLRRRFESLSKAKRREYADYIAQAKRAETRQRRLQKILPMIQAGVGLNDRYRP